MQGLLHRLNRVTLASQHGNESMIAQKVAAADRCLKCQATKVECSCSLFVSIIRPFLYLREHCKYIQGLRGLLNKFCFDKGFGSRVINDLTQSLHQ